MFPPNSSDFDRFRYSEIARSNPFTDDQGQYDFDTESETSSMYEDLSPVRTLTDLSEIVELYSHEQKHAVEESPRDCPSTYSYPMSRNANMFENVVTAVRPSFVTPIPPLPELIGVLERSSTKLSQRSNVPAYNPVAAGLQKHFRHQSDSPLYHTQISNQNNRSEQPQNNHFKQPPNKSSLPSRKPVPSSHYSTSIFSTETSLSSEPTRSSRPIVSSKTVSYSRPIVSPKHHPSRKPTLTSPIHYSTPQTRPRPTSSPLPPKTPTQPTLQTKTTDEEMMCLSTLSSLFGRQVRSGGQGTWLARGTMRFDPKQELKRLKLQAKRDKAEEKAQAKAFKKAAREQL